MGNESILYKTRRCPFIVHYVVIYKPQLCIWAFKVLTSYIIKNCSDHKRSQTYQSQFYAESFKKTINVTLACTVPIVPFNDVLQTRSRHPADRRNIKYRNILWSGEPSPLQGGRHDTFRSAIQSADWLSATLCACGCIYWLICSFMTYYIYSHFDMFFNFIIYRPLLSFDLLTLLNEQKYKSWKLRMSPNKGEFILRHNENFNIFS